MSQYARGAVDSLNSGAGNGSPAGAAAGDSLDENGQAGGPQHKRVYQACIPCRRRKVRCDLGSVDNPRDPPCVRCRRESKECYFSATRRKRKGDEDGVDDDEYLVRNARKRVHAEEGTPPLAGRNAYNNMPLTPGTGPGRSQALRRPGADRKSSGVQDYDGMDVEEEDPNTQLENLEAQTIMRQEVYGPHDALNLLYKAATDGPHSPSLHKRTESMPAAAQPSTNAMAANQKYGVGPQAFNPLPTNMPRAPSAGPIDPQLVDSRSATEKLHSFEQEQKDRNEIETRLSGLVNEPGYDDALQAWGRFRFVRAGWFTREEAIKFIAYYYEYLSPLTPVSPPTFRTPATHNTLLMEEPILTVTLLTISSRYYKVPGPGGHCRSHAIHEELWKYLRRMIERCFWGQEAFGGGFCGSGADDSQTSSTAPWRGLRKGSLRTLGTIESLMILTEWHPRALHFPPDEATDELMLPSYDRRDQGDVDEDGNPRPMGNVGGRRIESWLEPAWRSDRMSWMLLSTAHGLAYELGVFDDIDELIADNAITRPEYEDEGYRLRATRIKRLLLTYLTQLAGRLGWTNMVPDDLRRKDPALSRIRPATNDGNTPGTTNSATNSFNYVPNAEIDDQVITCWVGVSNVMHMGNQTLFKSRKHTTEIIQNGKYTQLLQDLQPILRTWNREFERVQLPQFIRHILTIEYEYVRIYINSLALQAVVERCTTNAGGTDGTAQGANLGNGPTQLSPQTQNYLGGLPLGHLGGFGAEDQDFVKEVVEGCRNLLRTVVDGLLPNGYLKHAPVRTYFRIISGAMFLLKTFALGAPRSDVELSISLMDRTVDALRGCVVDDVHLGIRFGDLLESLTSRLRARFKHAPTLGLQIDGKVNDGVTGGESSKATSVNGLTHTNGVDNTHLKIKDGFNPPDRTGTPSNLISATPFDLGNGTFPYPAAASSVFGTPGPSGGMDNTNNNSSSLPADFDTDWNNPDDQMWYLPPGPGLFQNMGENTNVTMTDQGVNVGGLDLLDYMAMDATQPYVMESSGF